MIFDCKKSLADGFEQWAISDLFDAQRKEAERSAQVVGWLRQNGVETASA